MNAELKVLDLLDAESEHHILSPSSADRWMTCAASAKESLRFLGEDTTSEAAEEGRIAHDFAEKRLLKKIRPSTVKKHDEEMSFHVEDYVAYCKALAGKNKYWVEQRLDIGEYITGCKGTSDFITYDAEGMIVDIVDLKYGKGVKVYVNRNRQAMLYGLGVLAAFRKKGMKIRKIRLHIYQPRLGNIDVWECSVEELEEFGEEVKVAVQACISPNPQYSPSEKGCMWCPAQSTCPSLYEHTVALFRDDFDPIPLDELTDDQIKLLLDNKSLIEKYLRSVEAHIFNRVERGDHFPGYKMVSGRSQRRWKTGAEDRLQEVLGDSAFTTKLKNITELEKALGKQRFAEMDLTDKPPGKPTMVADTDPRPAITTGDLVEDFKNLEEES